MHACIFTQVYVYIPNWIQISIFSSICICISTDINIGIALVTEFRLKMVNWVCPDKPCMYKFAYDIFPLDPKIELRKNAENRHILGPFPSTKIPSGCT